MRLISYASKTDTTVRFAYFTPEEWNNMQLQGYFEVDMTKFNGDME